MSTVEQIAEKAKTLPEPLQTEALHFVNYLLSLKDAKADEADWSTFSSGQLAKQYGPGDEIYDVD